MFNKLRQAQDPGKSRDPLQYLPLELAEMVCQHLSMRDKV
jgi:F-box/TPR repeat protein Pof3